MRILASFIVAFVLQPALPAAQSIPATSAGPSQSNVLFDGRRGSFPGCPTCGVWSWVDYPAPLSQVSTRAFSLSGWGFECVSGQAVDRVDVFYQDYDGVNHPTQLLPTSRYGFIHRWDVVLFGVSVDCGVVDLYSGWAVTVTGVPPGLRLITINVWRGPYVETHERIYLVKP